VKEEKPSVDGCILIRNDAKEFAGVIRR